MRLNLGFWALFSMSIIANFTVCAQENFLETYHPNRNKAEMAIVADDYKTAAKYYSEAFGAVKNPLAKDIFNAMVCHLLMDDFDMAKKYLIKLAGKGIAEELMNAVTIFNDDKYRLFWEQNQAIYKSIEKLLLETNDIENNMTKGDLKMNAVITDSSGNVVSNHNYSVFGSVEEALKSLDMDGIIPEEKSFLIDNIKHKERINLHHNIDFSTYNNLKKDIDRNFTITELSHVINFYLKNTPEDSISILKIKEKIIEAVKLGILNPYYALENSPNYKKILYTNKPSLLKINVTDDANCTFYKDKIYYKKSIMTEKQLADYEESKILFGLESVEEKKQKNLYSQLKNKYFILPNYLIFEAISVNNCEEADREQVGFTLIEN